MTLLMLLLLLLLLMMIIATLMAASLALPAYSPTKRYIFFDKQSRNLLEQSSPICFFLFLMVHVWGGDDQSLKLNSLNHNLSLAFAYLFDLFFIADSHRIT